MERLERTVATGLLCISTVFTLCACVPKKESIPVVVCNGNEVTVNGKAVAQSYDYVYFNRIDSSVVSFSLMPSVAKDGSVNVVNVDSDGNEIKLSSVITDPDLYESAVVDKIHQPIILTRDSVYTGPEVNRDAMEEVLCSYDKAMTLPFLMGYDGVAIFYTEDSGASYTVSFDYDSGVIDKRFVPGDGIICHPWMTGRVGNGVTGMILEGYSDHWAENSMEIDNYNGHTYYWFCVAYKDDKGNKTYYSVVAEENDNGREVIFSQRAEGSFVCCDIEEFGRILDGKQGTG